jgi:hypothetical protein
MKDISSHRWHQSIGIITFAVLFAGACAGPDKEEVSSQLAVARTTVSDAANSEAAAEFAPTELKAAQERLDAAEKAAMAGDRREAKRLAEKAQLDAQLASAKARAGRAQQATAALEARERALREEMNRAAE